MNNIKKGSKTHNLLYDTPLQVPEQDRLGVAKFSKILADAILKMDAEEGFVFALNGPWGSGKTTTINFVLHYLKQQTHNEIVIVRFNPWWFSGREQLLQHFFRQFRTVLEKNVTKNLMKIGKKLEHLANILDPAFQKIGVSSRSIAATMKKDIFEVRNSIDSMLQKQSVRILVVIDDIDRLSTQEIRQIFQLVKAVADFPKTIYFLAFDRNVVINALKEVQGLDGEAYLEKIVQAQFNLPYPDRTSLRRLLFELLDEVILDTPEDRWDSTEWGNLYWDGIDPFIQTPRDIKRFINALRPTYPVVKEEVNPVDFIGIQALRIFVPEIYDFIATSKDLLAGESNSRDFYEAKDAYRNFFESVIERLPEKKREPVKGMMKRLFPKWSTVFGGASYGTNWLESWRRELRVCSPDIFDRYFMLTVPPGEIFSAEMQAILELASDPQAFSSELVRLSKEHRPDGTTRLRVFLERMLDFTEKDIPEEHIEPILRAIYTIGDQLYIESDRVSMLDDGNDMRLLRITYRLLRRLQTQEQRFDMLSKMYKEGKALFLIVREMTFLGIEHGKYTNKQPEEPEEKRTVSAEHLSQLETLVLQKIRDAAKENTLQKTPELGRVLYRFSDLGTEEEVKEYVSGLIKNDEGLCDYLAGFLWKSHSHTLGDRVERRTWRISVDFVQKFIDGDAANLLPRCQKLLKDQPNWLKDRRKIAIETFIQEITNPEVR
jgi:predicted KAP-like P-loop ATPase